MRQSRWIYLVVLSLVSRAAHAHGEDVLTSIYAEIISVALCIAFLFLRKEAKPFCAIGFAACIAGVIAVNWALADVPYLQNQSMIMVVEFIMPLMATFSVIQISKIIANHKK